ncbi:hypothetical protein BDF20DRAFT_848305 [Mycotypha africana]|uniref:uncharacterized protein n=1 Tax=Mycotypha africana TaxID=64632 RepID=UPI0022FFC9FF|nr:uncharacterized protein BDF20DRAFT_848305 [Mycotypha africana]KAI8992105.1 hypothetical protein BDF20DRAFT_848305 [Mycotypha africana]
MTDQGSMYTILQGVPVMVSPLYTLPKKVFVASELKMVIDDVAKLVSSSFARIFEMVY